VRGACGRGALPCLPGCPGAGAPPFLILAILLVLLLLTLSLQLAH